MAPLRDHAPAKVNLTLRVRARRTDGFHDLDSLTAFADAGDTLTFAPGGPLALKVSGPFAGASGDVEGNLVLRAARELSRRVPDLPLGVFHLSKRLPVAAGLGGGSSDAAAALRLLAQAGGIPPDDARIVAAARELGSDVPVCLDPRARRMTGRGDILGQPLPMPPLACVLVNPGVAVPTPPVFAALGLKPGDAGPGAHEAERDARTRADWLALIRASANDLAAPARTLAPEIAEVEAALAATGHVELVRMTGSGATVFALYPGRAHARAAARLLRRERPDWWVRAALLR